MPPLVWRVPIYLAGWLVPARERMEWRRKWTSNLDSWQVLVERGELPAGSFGEILSRALRDASLERFGVIQGGGLLRGPIFLAAACAGLIPLIALCSHGFATCRILVATARDMRLHPDLGLRYDLRGDRLFSYLAPVVISACVGIALVFLKRRSLGSLGWRSWSLLLFKLLSIHISASLLWVEGGHALRSQLAREGLRFGIAGFGLALAFIFSFGFATIWSIADQRARCPVCLRRLVMPVTLGSWASSFFDPAATELVCEEGHGALALMETEDDAAAPDRWVELDASWQYLFPPRSGKSG